PAREDGAWGSHPRICESDPGGGGPRGGADAATAGLQPAAGAGGAGGEPEFPSPGFRDAAAAVDRRRHRDADGAGPASGESESGPRADGTGGDEPGDE